MKPAPTTKKTPLRTRLLFVALCALSGTLLFLACADFDIWPLAWVGMGPWLYVVLDEDCQSPFFYGWVAGLLGNGGGFYWINGLLQRFGHMPFIASAPIFSLMIAYQALEWGAFAWALRRLRDHTKLPITLLAPITFTALELITPFIFPWYFAITQAWVRPIIQIADLTGPLGVSFLLVLSNAALYETVMPILRREKAPWKPMAAALGVIGLALVYGQIRIHQVEAMRARAPHIKVGLVQANIGIQEKWDPRFASQELAIHQKLSADLQQKGADLVVWPESSYPYPIDRDQTEDFPDRSPAHVQRGFSTPLFFGALTRDRSGAESPYPFNTAIMQNAQGEFTARFDKNFLLVFGEYIPFYERMKWVREVIPEASNFARGDSVTTFPLEVPRLGERGHVKLGPMICYEDIIPSFGRRLVALGPNLLVNITNDAWFGATSEPYEHLALAVYRAVEHRLDLVRAVNTGVSAYVDATGRVYKRGPAVDPAVNPTPPLALIDEMAVLDATGPFGRIGDLFGLLNLAALLAFTAWAAHRGGRPVRWRAVGEATGLLVVGFMLAVLAAAPTKLALGFGLLAHQPMPSTNDTFSAGLRLLGAAALASFGVGFYLRRRFPTGALRAEAAIAAAVCALGPTFLFGRLEGETTSLVFTLLGTLGLMAAGLRVAARK